MGAQGRGKEETIPKYRVKANDRSVYKAQKDAQRHTVAQALVKAMKRMKERSN